MGQRVETWSALELNDNEEFLRERVDGAIALASRLVSVLTLPSAVKSFRPKLRRQRERASLLTTAARGRHVQKSYLTKLQNLRTNKANEIQ
jgi:hypothetical protein